MIFEKKCLIELSDITAVQYQCSTCRAATSVPIEKLNLDQLAFTAKAVCPYCQTPSGLQISTNEMKLFLEFNQALISIVAAMKGRNLNMLLDIKCSE